MAPEPSPNRPTLKQRALRAGGWSFAGYGLSQLIRLGSSLVMTRLLAPEMFGVMTIAAMVVVVLALLSDIGLVQNIVQSPRGDDPVFLDTAWVVQIIRGGVLWLIALLLSIALHLANLERLFPVNSVYASPVLPLVIAISSLSAVISGFQSTKMASALRSFDQRRANEIALIGQIVGLFIMIVIGIITRSIWALVAGGLIASLTTTALSHIWLSGHTNSFRSEKNALRELMSFGKWIFISSAAGVFAANGDRLLLGAFAETHVLGLYAIAILIIGAIEGAFSRLFITVSLPALSEIASKDPSRLREIYYKLRVPADLVLLFLTGLLFAAGQLVIDVLYDPRYSAAGGMVQILALSLFAVRYEVARQLYLALGIPRYGTVMSLLRFVAIYALVPPLYYFGGLHAAIWGIALHALATVPFVYAVNAQLGLNDFRREIIVLVALPAGFLCGITLNEFLV